MYALAFYFNLRTLTWILNNVLQVGFLALVVVFQPELRRALEQLGRTDVWMASLFRTHRDDSTVRARWQTATVAICDAAEQLSDTRTGALIVLERNSNLSEIIRTGTPLNGDVNREMLGTIFYEGTPLHDGAVVVRDGMLKAAGCVLPLSNNLEIGKDMGTRHRAALGLSLIHILLGGEPGAGKSTLLLQLCGAISSRFQVLYITGEESVRQVKLRADRLGIAQESILLAAENDIDQICGLIERDKPDLVVIDSIQTMHTTDLTASTGSVSQVKECAARLLNEMCIRDRC